MVGKRKADDLKSTNANTQRVEKRRREMTDRERQIDNAKRADVAAQTYAVKKLRKRQDWIAAAPTEQEKMIQDCKDAVTHKRKVDRVHSSILEQQQGIGAGGGLYALFDDGNQAWETEDEDDEAAQEELWRADEKINGETISDIAAEKEKGEEHVARSNLKYKALGFRIWRRKWNSAYKSTIRLIKKINHDPDFLKNLPPAVDPKTSQFYEHIPPHLFFRKVEMAVWRNFMSWGMAEEDEIVLPGPAEWYPEGYDATAHGFVLLEDAEGAFRAWEMLREEEEPTDFAWVLPSDETLVVLPQTKESAELLDEIYTL